MSVKLLSEQHLEFLSLKGGCTGSSESTLVKIPHLLEISQYGRKTYCSFLDSIPNGLDIKFIQVKINTRNVSLFSHVMTTHFLVFVCFVRPTHQLWSNGDGQLI